MLPFRPPMARSRTVRRERETGNRATFSQVGEPLPVGRIPDADVPQGVPGHKGPPVRAERDTRDRAALGQGGGLLPGRHVPQADMTAAVAGGQGLSVRAERDARRRRCPRRGWRSSARWPRPTSRRDRRSRRRPGSARPGLNATLSTVAAFGQGGGLLPGGHVPQADITAVVADGQGPPVRAERDAVDRAAFGQGGGLAARWPRPTSRRHRRSRRRPGSARPG